MSRTLLLPLAALAIAVLGGTAWLLARPETAAPAPARSPETRSTPPAPAENALQRPQETTKSRSDDARPEITVVRTVDSPAPVAQPRVVEPEVDPRDIDYPPAAGIAATASVVLGGRDAFVTAYEKYGAQERQDRMLELETALAEYVHGEPKDADGQARYSAFKDELYWWRENRR